MASAARLLPPPNRTLAASLPSVRALTGSPTAATRSGHRAGETSVWRFSFDRRVCGRATDDTEAAQPPPPRVGAHRGPIARPTLSTWLGLLGPSLPTLRSRPPQPLLRVSMSTQDRIIAASLAVSPVGSHYLGGLTCTTPSSARIASSKASSATRPASYAASHPGALLGIGLDPPFSPWIVKPSTLSIASSRALVAMRVSGRRETRRNSRTHRPQSGGISTVTSVGVLPFW